MFVTRKYLQYKELNCRLHIKCKKSQHWKTQQETMLSIIEWMFPHETALEKRSYNI